MKDNLLNIYNTAILYNINPHINNENLSNMVKFENGFRGIFYKSLDKPFLDNHIFVMYELDKLDNNWSIRDKLFNKSNWIYDEYILHKKYKTYIVYVFINNTKENDLNKILPLEEPLQWNIYINQKSQGLSIDKS